MWAPHARTRVPVRGVDCSDPKRGCLAFHGIPHRLGKHMGMCLYGMTSLQCVEAFSPAQLGEEQNREGHGTQSGQYLHSWGEVVTIYHFFFFLEKIIMHISIDRRKSKQTNSISYQKIWNWCQSKLVLFPFKRKLVVLIFLLFFSLVLWRMYLLDLLHEGAFSNTYNSINWECYIQILYITSCKTHAMHENN